MRDSEGAAFPNQESFAPERLIQLYALGRKAWVASKDIKAFKNLLEFSCHVISVVILDQFFITAAFEKD